MRDISCQEAFSILGADPSDPETVIKRKYRELIRRYHPDTGEEPSESAAQSTKDHAIRTVIAAYETIKKSGCLRNRTGRGERIPVPVNPAAFCERSLYGYHDVFEEFPEDIYLKGNGRFVWDPDHEEFTLYMKSINEAAGRLLSERETRNGIYGADDVYDPSFAGERSACRIRIFHFLAQQFISPLDCLKKIYGGVNDEAFQVAGRIRYTGAGRMKKTADSGNMLTQAEAEAAAGILWPCSMKKNSLCMTVTLPGIPVKTLDVSFDDDCLYYIIGPLLARKAAEITAAAGNTAKAGKGYLPVLITIHITDPDNARRMGDTAQYIAAELDRYEAVRRSCSPR